MLQRELSSEDVGTESCKISQSAPISQDVKRICRTSVEHDTQTTVTDHSQASASMSSCTRDVADIVGGSCLSDASGNNSSQSTLVGSSGNQPASAGSSQPTSTASVMEPVKEASSLLVAEVVLSSQPISQSSAPLQVQEQHRSTEVPSSVTSSQDTAKASTSDLNQLRASSFDEIEASLQCVICQEILYKCVRSVLHWLFGLCYLCVMLSSSDIIRFGFSDSVLLNL